MNGLQEYTQQMCVFYILFLVALFIESSYKHIMDMNGFLYNCKDDVFWTAYYSYSLFAMFKSNLWPVDSITID